MEVSEHYEEYSYSRNANKDVLNKLKKAGIRAKVSSSPFNGLSAVTVFGPKAVQMKAAKIIWGKRWGFSHDSY